MSKESTQAPTLGHRKISAGLATWAGGAAAGQEFLLWLWNTVAGWPTMTEEMAANLFALITLIVIYFVGEEASRK